MLSVDSRHNSVTSELLLHILFFFYQSDPVVLAMQVVGLETRLHFHAMMVAQTAYSK